MEKKIWISIITGTEMRAIDKTLRITEGVELIPDTKIQVTAKVPSHFRW
jgi:hypothetical protein